MRLRIISGIAFVIAMSLVSTSSAVQLTRHETYRDPETHVKRHFEYKVDVAPRDSDDDGFANKEDDCPHDGYTGNGGCTPEPAPVAPVVETSTTTTYSGSTVMCESGGDYSVYDPTGTYWGGWQFDESTWNAYNVAGGEWGSATPAQQDAAAAAVPYDAWPNC